ncbi:MAG: LCP family protein [Clostridium sp.]|nr:LCP family protein [Clostridium sp.]
MGDEEKRNYSKEYQEMIRIEEGLEQFLEQELQDMRSAQAIPGTVSAAGCRTATKTTNNAEEVTMANTKNTKRRKPSKALPDDYIDDWDKSPSSGDKKIPAKKQRKMRWKRFLITVVLLIALLGLAHYCLVASVYGKMNYKAIENKSITDAPLKEDGVINILLIGNDSRQNGEDGRSDAMILLSVSTKTQKIYMTSLLRDMYVEIPGHDGNRLNAAYAYGGAGLLMQTIEQNLNISVNRYMLVNFEAFANLVDAVKGIELELSSEEVAYVNGYLEEYNILTKRPEGTDYMDTSLSGMLHLNGPQALAYTRNRYLGTDFGRTERQRKVLSAVIKKLPKAAVTNSKELMDGLLPNLTTNLTQNECYLLSFYAPKLLTYELVQNSIPMDGTYKNANIRGMAVLEVDFDANKKYIRENVYGN